jgi:ABC-2 type transport system ATP-binding protein
MSSAPLIVESLVRRFGDRLALDGASFQLYRGEFLALLGPNGAGKTTLIRIISGRLRADSGQVLIHGLAQEPGGRPDVMQKLGIIPQNIALYDQLTARENLELFGNIFGVSSKDLSTRIEDALIWTGLEDRSREPVSGFSGGMQRRLNIACGVLHRPDIILLDEPTVGVDPQSRQRIWEMLKQLQSQGVSIVLTTHQLDEAQQICDRIVIMDRGRTIASGTFDQLLENSIGRRRRVVFSLSKPVASHQTFASGFQWRDDRTPVAEVEDVVTELPECLKALADAGLSVADLSIETPSLQSVFLHFTGHELRESGSLS